jgi:hypothetical protein
VAGAAKSSFGFLAVAGQREVNASCGNPDTHTAILGIYKNAQSI